VGPYKEQIEPIANFSISIDTMIFTVLNSGYTGKDSFRLDIQKASTTTCKAILVRIHPDYGKMVELPCEIVYAQDELEGRIDFRQKLYVENPFYIYRD
jgi:hypothetical protein